MIVNMFVVRSSTVSSVVLQTPLNVTEAPGGNAIAIAAVVALVVEAIVAFVFDFPAIRASASLFRNRIRIVLMNRTDEPSTESDAVATDSAITGSAPDDGEQPTTSAQQNDDAIL